MQAALWSRIRAVSLRQRSVEAGNAELDHRTRARLAGRQRPSAARHPGLWYAHAEGTAHRQWRRGNELPHVGAAWLTAGVPAGSAARAGLERDTTTARVLAEYVSTHVDDHVCVAEFAAMSRQSGPTSTLSSKSSIGYPPCNIKPSYGWRRPENLEPTDQSIAAAAG